MHNKLHLLSAFTFALAFATGCPADEPGDGDAGADTGTAGDDGSGTAADDGMTSMNDTGADTMADGMDGMDDTPGTDTMPGTDDDGPMPLPDGSQCGADEECESMNCYVAGVLGGICGECNEDADCEFGCSLPNPITSSPSFCNDGEAGGGCESDEVCQDGLVCAEILNVPGVLMAATCSECNTDAECTDQLCQPSYDVINISGQKACVDAGSLADGEGCELDMASSDGNAACMSGFCATASFMDLLMLGVCSGCVVDGDCGMGEVCNPPEIDLAEGLVPGSCGPMR